MPTPVGSRLRELRIAAGLSQSDVATRVGVTKSRVSQWETDEAAGIDSRKRLEELAALFGVQVEDMLVAPRFTPPARVPRRAKTGGAVIVPLPARVPPELLIRRIEAGEAAMPATPMAGLNALQQAAVDAFCKACRAGQIDDQQALTWLNEWHGLLSGAAARLR